MFSVPLYIFLFIYFLFLLIFAIFSLINILHVAQTGSMTMVSFFVTFITMALAVFVFYATWWLLKDTDWQIQAMVWDNEWIKNLFTNNQFSSFKVTL